MAEAAALLLAAAALLAEALAEALLLALAEASDEELAILALDDARLLSARETSTTEALTADEALDAD